MEKLFPCFRPRPAVLFGGIWFGDLNFEDDGRLEGLVHAGVLGAVDE